MRAAMTAVLASLVAALCLMGLAAPPASAQQSPPTDIALGSGRNDTGELGDGTTTRTNTPVNVDLPAGVELTDISAGSGTSLGLTSDGRVLAWGQNNVGQLGDGTTIDRLTPVQVHLPAGVQATAISAGYGYGLALTSDGRVFAWGGNWYGQLGDGTTTHRSTPVEVLLPTGTQVTAISGGGSHSLALTSDGRVLAWGQNSYGQLGDGTTFNRSTPVEVHLPTGVQVTAISAGINFSLALTSDGRVLAWGQNSSGQLGDGTTSNRSTPVEVLLPAGTQVTAVAGGSSHSLAVTSDGRVLAWGYNNEGQLGDGTRTSSSTPVEVLLPTGTQVTAIAAGYHSLAVTSDGRALAWGRNWYGELGDGTDTNRLTPIAMHLPAGVHATAVSAGNDFTLALAVRAESATTLTAAPNPAALGQPVALSAHATCTTGTPTGQVVFTSNGIVIGTVTLDAQGNATLTTTNLPLGSNQISAHYQGAGTCPASDSAPVFVTVEQAPQASLHLDKQVQSSGPFHVGDTVDYAYTVTNTGEVPLNNVTVTDDLVAGVTCDTTSLLPAESTTCHGSHTLTQAGQVTNTALATANTAPGAEITSNQASATITVEVPPATELTLTKRVVSRGPFHIGDQVDYAYTVANIGDVPLHNVAVTDDLVTGITCDTTTLPPGQSTTCHGSHTLTQAGQVTNTAHATAVDPAGNPVISNTATATITVEVPPATELTLTKRVVSKGPFRIGDKVQYAYTVANTNNTSLNGVKVTDNLVAGVACMATTLAPGASTTCTGTHTITKADVTPCKTAKERGGDHGKGTHQVMRCRVTNTAHATAIDPNGNQVTSNQATATITVTVEKRKEKKEHCRKHHGGHKRAYGGYDCDGHHGRVAEQA